MSMPKQKPGKSKQDYATPIEFSLAVRNHIGIANWEFDFAASAKNTKAARYWTEKDDSLSKKSATWHQQIGNGWGWLNPPYANISHWVLKCALVNYKGGRIALLVPASVGSNWYRDYIDQTPGVEVLFVNPRISFDGKHPYPKDCMLVLFTGTTESFRTSVWKWKETTK